MASTENSVVFRIALMTLAALGGCGNAGAGNWDEKADAAGSMLLASSDLAITATPADASSDLGWPDLSSAAGDGGPQQRRKIFAGYYQTWSEPWKADGAQTPLANLPGYVNVVLLSFMRPDATYAAGSISLAGTGLQFPFDGTTLKQALAALRKRQPATEVLAAVGGATYTNWQSLDAQAIAQFVKDYGLDGVDIDFEPANPACAVMNGSVFCQSDADFIAAALALRKALPRPARITVAAWSTGAFGEKTWANAQPQGAYTGLCLNLLRSAAGAGIDRLHVMSYDASNAYDPAQALAAYQNYFKGPVIMGVEVPPEAWGGHVLSMTAVSALADAVTAQEGGGLMIWSLQKQPNGMASAQNPNATMIAQAACMKFNLPECQLPLPFP